ncbi:lipopolysaccharide assembly protein LapA domain-containing protein [Horticoccus luteus]|uniref:Lipopolysaccharide assembly protein LapA domain-containing protein n=1 Tax=Horticoccus luteus TaxID=2862869 RepID=A0A8F9XKX5_9BACT|nr:lipopolysaccharide assembly protein LapA domain-containing protein [Horticoccus luteus]QYM80138.1 lipopolysaccharide assembly protein LapA domain-containing protein [Horticoccus luteus]
MNWRVILSLLLLLVLGIFGLQNTTVLTVTFFGWSGQLSQALLIAICGGLGVLLGFLLGVSCKSRRKSRV